MNFNWKIKTKRGQEAIGFVDVHESNEGSRVIVIIHYLPQHTYKQQRVILTVLLEGEKSKWTDGAIDSIFEYAENQILVYRLTNFKEQNKLPYIDTQLFTMKNIEDFEYFAHGDQAFAL